MQKGRQPCAAALVKLHSFRFRRVPAALPVSATSSLFSRRPFLPAGGIDRGDRIFPQIPTRVAGTRIFCILPALPRGGNRPRLCRFFARPFCKKADSPAPQRSFAALPSGRRGYDPERRDTLFFPARGAGKAHRTQGLGFPPRPVRSGGSAPRKKHPFWGALWDELTKKMPMNQVHLI